MSAAICAAHDWLVGDEISAFDGDRTVVVKITAIGQNCILGIQRTGRGGAYEAAWSLAGRDWRIFRRRARTLEQVAASDAPLPWNEAKVLLREAAICRAMKALESLGARKPVPLAEFEACAAELRALMKGPADV